MNKGRLAILGMVIVAAVLLLTGRGETIKSKSTNVSGPASSTSTSSTTASEKSDDVCKKSLCVTFAGDIALGDNFFLKENRRDLYARAYSSFFDGFRDFLHASNAAIATLKSPLITSDLLEKKGAGPRNERFWADAVRASATFREVGITALSLANRNIGNWGDDGVDATTGALSKEGVHWFGVSKEKDGPAELYRLVLQNSNDRAMVAILGVMAYGNIGELERWTVASLENSVLNEKIRALKKSEPELIVVVFPSWGRPYRWTTKEQQQLARSWVDAGADFVIGHGTHMIQTVERFKTSWIVYGLGNLVFNSKGAYNQRLDRVPYSAALRLVIRLTPHGREKTLRVYPIFTDNLQDDYQGRFLSLKELGNVYWRFLEKREIIYDWHLKAKMFPGQDRYGRFIELAAEDLQ